MELLVGVFPNLKFYFKIYKIGSEDILVLLHIFQMT